MRKEAELSLEKMRYGKKERALFYLGAMVRTVDTYSPKFADRIFIESEFEADIKKLFNQTMEKISEHDLEEPLGWTMKGFVENYTDEVETMPKYEKKFYLASGSALAGIHSEWRTSADLTAKYGLSSSTVRKAISEGRISENECRKSGGIWLIKDTAGERLWKEREKQKDEEFPDL